MGAIMKNGVLYGGSISQTQSNWTESNPTSAAYIQNKPTLGTASAKDSTTTISDGGTDLPTSGAVYTALQNVHIDVDTTLDTTSNNPIANSAVATALNGKVDAVTGKGLSTNDYTDAEQTKLSGIATGAEVNVQSNWTESDNTSDAFILNKPTLGTAASKDSTTSITENSNDLITSGAVYTGLSGKVDTESGKGLSTNDYTTEEKTKLSGIATGAEVNVQANWNETSSSSDAYIQNKPTALSDFTNDSGFITNTVNNLTNYYTTSNTYTKTEVDTLIAAAKNGRFEVVAILPTTDIKTNVIYLLPKTVSQTDNIYDEYINTDGTTAGWEKIGDTQIDLSNYVQKSSTSGLIKNDGTIDTNTYLTATDIATTSSVGVVKVDGTSITIDNNGTIHSALSGNDTIKKRYEITSTNWSSTVDANNYYTYVVSLLDQSFKLSTSVNVYIAGSTDTTAPTSTETNQYKLLKKVELTTTSSVTLYAEEKPSSTFYVYIGSDGGPSSMDSEDRTATGNPITLTDAVAGNALEVSAEIVASQDLHGFDKPWVGGSGKNKIDISLSTANRFINSSGETTYYEGWYASDYTPVNANADMVFNPNSSAGDSAKHAFYDSGKNFISAIASGQRAFTTPSNCAYMRFSYRNDSSDIQLEYGTTATSYEPYANICPISGFSSVVITDTDSESHTATVTVALGSTVYGGTLNLTTGELTITYAVVDLGTLTYGKTGNDSKAFSTNSIKNEIKPCAWSSEITTTICSQYSADTGSNVYTLKTDGTFGVDANGQIYFYDSRFEAETAANIKTALSGVQFVYELKTPTTTTLTAAQLALVKGQNTLTCNSGDMSITYKASGLDALKERVDELEDAVADLETDVASKAEKTTIGTVENGTTASQAYAVGEHFIRNDKFCTAIAAIASGATFTLNTNYVEGTIAEAITNKYNYSTTEHVVGTWIDGKTLYERTFEVGNLPSGGATLYNTDISTSIVPAANIKRLFGQATSATNGMIPLPFTNGGQASDSIYNVGLAITISNNKLNIFLHSSTNRSDFTATVTMHYTKNS